MRIKTAVVLLLISQMAKAQAILHGRVIDQATHEPLEMAVVTDLHTGKNYLTDNNGYFKLKTTGATNIRVSMIGYIAQTMTSQPNKLQTIALVRGALDLKEVIITNNIAGTGVGSFRTLSKIDLNMQPVRSAQDLLRLVPGLFIAQHQGGGKAEQIFLRGFDADHGTDVNISVDGLPVNMVSQAHGQGYADLHFLIPETVAGYDFGKGPYYTSKGDMCTAGFVDYETKNVLENNMVKIEGGQFSTGRIVAGVNVLKNKAYIAADALYTNGGPFLFPEHFKRYNLFGKYSSQISPKTKLTII